jgi:hypothetical protein
MPRFDEDLTPEHREHIRSWVRDNYTRMRTGESCMDPRCGKFIAMPNLAKGQPRLCHECAEKKREAERCPGS